MVTPKIDNRIDSHIARKSGRKTATHHPQLTWSQVMAWRQRRHQLHERAPRSAMLEVTSRIGCLQAQLMSSAELALWARVDGLEPDAMARALWEERTLVKTWAMRGTMHILPSSELTLWQRAAAMPHDRPPMSQYLERLEISQETVPQLIAAVGEALHGRELTREELADEVARITGSTVLGDKLRSGWGTLLKPAAWLGLLCFAPGEGQKVRFTHPGTWFQAKGIEAPDIAPLPATPIDLSGAQLEVTRRFLSGNGPATRAALATWLAITPPKAGALFDALGDEVCQVDIEGSQAWMLAAQVAEVAAATTSSQVRLLPAFDPYVIAASPYGDHFLSGDFRSRIYKPNTWYSPVLAVDGRMEGIWSHEKKGKKLEVKIEPFRELSGWAREAAAVEAERLAGFLGGKLSLSFEQAIASQ